MKWREEIDDYVVWLTLSDCCHVPTSSQFVSVLTDIFNWCRVNPFVQLNQIKSKMVEKKH